MWFFDWFETYFGDLQSRFQGLADSIGGVPYVGPSLASPFGYVANFFANLRTASSYASDWADAVYDDASQIFSDIRSTIAGTWPVLTATASWFFGQVRDQIASYWSILSMSASSVVSWISSALRSAFPVLTATASWFFGQVRDQIASYWSILSMSASSMASWLWPALQALGAGAGLTIDAIWSLITTGRLPGWISTWWAGQSSAVATFVTNQWGYLIASAFTFLGSNWASFENSFAWLTGKILKKMTDEAASFSDAIWDLVEAVVRKL
jgi:hypothetical protein